MHTERTIEEKNITQSHTPTNQSNAIVSNDTSIDVQDLAKHGQYHRSDRVDFVHMQHLPQPEQPVFERVLLPEKKRPTINRIPDPQTTAVIQTMPIDDDDYDENHMHSEYLNGNFNNQIPKYAIAQRHQSPSSHRTTYAKPMHSTTMSQQRQQPQQQHNIRKSR